MQNENLKMFLKIIFLEHDKAFESAFLQLSLDGAPNLAIYLEVDFFLKGGQVSSAIYNINISKIWFADANVLHV